MLRKQFCCSRKKLLLPEVKQIFASRTQMLLPNHMFPSLATMTHCFIITEACSCRLELAYFTGKISKYRLVCKNAVAFAYYGSCMLLVMGSCVVLKPRPKDRNMPTQHIATLLGATCCVRLATLLRHVATCWVLLAQIWPVSNLSQQQPTCRNLSLHDGQTRATCCAQQCCDMSCWHVAIVWPGFYLLTKIYYFVSRAIKPRPNDSNIPTQHFPTLLAHHLQVPAERSQHCWAQHVARLWPPCCEVLRHVAS